jgi:hypothetical protein
MQASDLLAVHDHVQKVCCALADRLFASRQVRPDENAHMFPGQVLLCTLEKVLVFIADEPCVRTVFVKKRTCCSNSVPEAVMGICHLNAFAGY